MREIVSPSLTARSTPLALLTPPMNIKLTILIYRFTFRPANVYVEDNPTRLRGLADIHSRATKLVLLSGE